MRPTATPMTRFSTWLRGALLIGCALSGFSALPRAAAGATPCVERVRFFSGPEHTRVVLDLTAPARYDVRRVRDPERIAINVAGARFVATGAVTIDDGVIKRVRRNPGRRRAQVVLDLESEARYNCFALPAADGRPDRIVVDVFRPAAAPPGGGRNGAPAAPTPGRTRPFTVVIDPGHGGLDPGAIRDGLQEKDIVLEVALEMAGLLRELPGYRAVLTRDRDWYPSLARRVEIAREQEGDLFLSIHCNSHRRRAVSGMEVYFLSLQGATDREARELADKENAADLVGLAPDAPRNDLVMSILMDLKMTRGLHESQRFCLTLLETARSSDGVRARKVKQARFQVLRSLAMPSALVELAYLSNADDRRLLASKAGRRRLAAVLVDGIRAYRSGADDVIIAANEPVWTQDYRVRRGDNLWRLARRHGTTIAEIARHNRLSTSQLRVGQTLTLPKIE
jgi:N-acetylmuramoyl-L-alanine amidase